MDSWYNGTTKKPTFNTALEALAELSVVDKYYSINRGSEAEHIKMYNLAADLEDISSRLREIAEKIAP